MEKPREVVRATFSDGHTEDWQSSPDVDLPASSLRKLMAVILKPTPVSVEIMETAQPELPFQQESK